VFWDQTIGFQLHRHSMFSLWGQYPQLHPLQLAFQGATLMLALAVTVPAGRRTTAQVAALSGAILVGLELSATHWYSFYVSWFMPGVLLGLLAVGLPERAPAAATEAVPAAARRRRAALELAR